MRARRPHPGNFRVWPFSPPQRSFLPAAPASRPAQGGSQCAGARGSSGLRAALVAAGPARAEGARRRPWGVALSPGDGVPLKEAHPSSMSDGQGPPGWVGLGSEDLGGHSRTDCRCLWKFSGDGVGEGAAVPVPFITPAWNGAPKVKLGGAGGSQGITRSEALPGAVARWEQLEKRREFRVWRRPCVHLLSCLCGLGCIAQFQNLTSYKTEVKMISHYLGGRISETSEAT